MMAFRPYILRCCWWEAQNSQRGLAIRSLANLGLCEAQMAECSFGIDAWFSFQRTRPAKTHTHRDTKTHKQSPGSEYIPAALGLEVPIRACPDIPTVYVEPWSHGRPCLVAPLGFRVVGRSWHRASSTAVDEQDQIYRKMYYTTRIPILLVYGVYIRSRRISNINSIKAKIPREPCQ